MQVVSTPAVASVDALGDTSQSKPSSTWSRIKEQWARRDETINQMKWLYQDYLDSNLYQHLRFAWLALLTYFEAFVWVSTSLILLSKAGGSFWPAYIAGCSLLVNAIFSTFYVQVARL